jgi:multidrug transporter EmrE-like cation transporter
MRQRGAVNAPDVDVRHPLRSAVGLFRSKWWTLGYVVAGVAYAFHVGAMALAALSLVQAVLAGGLVVLGVVAERWFGFHLRRREWVGIALTAGGLALLFYVREPKPLWAVIALAMFIAPHAIGAPQPEEYASAAPEALAHRFIAATMIASLLFWAVLGALSGAFYKRFVAVG